MAFHSGRLSLLACDSDSDSSGSYILCSDSEDLLSERKESPATPLVESTPTQTPTPRRSEAVQSLLAVEQEQGDCARKFKQEKMGQGYEKYESNAGQMTSTEEGHSRMAHVPLTELLETENRLKNELDKGRKNHEAVLAENRKLSKELEEKSALVKKKECATDNLRMENLLLKKQLGDQTEDARKCKEALESQATDVRLLEINIENLSKELEESKNNSQLDSKLEKMINNNDVMKSENMRLITENEKLVRNDEILTEELRSVKEKYGDLQDSEKALNEKLGRYRERMKTMRNDLEDLKKEKATLTEIRTTQKRELDKQYAVISQLNLTNAELTISKQIEKERGKEEMEESFRELEKRFQQFCGNRNEIMAVGIDKLNRTKKQGEKIREVTKLLFQDLDHVVKNYEGKLSPFEESWKKLDGLVAQLTHSKTTCMNRMDSSMANHAKEYHRTNEEEKRMKKECGNRRAAFNTDFESFKCVQNVADEIRNETRKLIQDIRSDVTAVRVLNQNVDANLLLLEKRDSVNEDEEPKRYPEKLCEVFAEDINSPILKIGLEAHNFLNQRKLKMEEIIHRNQCVSLLVIYKEEGSLKETISMGYGENDKVSFTNAVESMKHNKQFMKHCKGASSSTTATVDQ